MRQRQVGAVLSTTVPPASSVASSCLLHQTSYSVSWSVRVHISALSSEQVCASLSQTKNRVKDEGRSDNQLRIRAQALQPERPGPLDEEVLRGGGV